MRTQARYVLVLLSSSYEGAEVLLPCEGAVHIGRGRGMDVLISAAGMSRRHACVTTTPEGLFIEDCGSTHGTYIHGARIETRTQMYDRDTFILGESIWRVGELEPDESARASSIEQERPIISNMRLHHRPAVLGMPQRPPSVALSDWLSLCSSSRSSYLLECVDTPHLCQIYIRGGIVHHIALEGESDPFDAFARMIALPDQGWTSRVWDGAEVTAHDLGVTLEELLEEVCAMIAARSE